jgi:dienelactone hydrolase
MVFNHGSERLPGDKRGQAEFFVPRGFVVFVPHRRGHGRSADAGPYVGAMNGAEARVTALETQVDDVSAAVAYVASLPFVDASRVAVSGCSFGGIEALFAAARTPGIVAAIDFAGGAMSWARSSLLQEKMKAAARGARVPVFFLQAANDWDTRPSEQLSSLMRDAGKPVRVRIFPANGATHEEGHAFCAGGPAPAWGDDVLAFLRAAGL